jgi:hypothetical protein
VGVVTVTKHVVPARRAGEATVMEEGPIIVTVAGWRTRAPPDASTKLTVAPETNPVPVIVTDMPPAATPEAGLIVTTVGTRYEYVNTDLVDVLVPPGVVTVRKYVVPAVTAGETAVIEDDPATATFVAATWGVPRLSTKFTVAPERNPVPVIVTDVPPAVDPLVGLRPVTVGALDE